MATVYATRWGDTLPVRIDIDETVEAHYGPERLPLEDGPGRLVLELTGGRCSHWSLGQYLREGRYSGGHVGPAATPLELFGDPPATPDSESSGVVSPWSWREWPGAPRRAPRVQPALTTLELFSRGDGGIILLEDNGSTPTDVAASSAVTTCRGERSSTGLTVLYEDSSGHPDAPGGAGRIRSELVPSPATKRSRGYRSSYRSSPRSEKRSRPGVEELGIDLAARGHEVAKLLYAGYGRRLHAAGYDASDVLQEVYKGILVRNRGRCPWDPRKSSFGHYVHMVCGCVVANYHRKQLRLRSREQIGINGFLDGQWGNRDASTHPLAKSNIESELEHTDAEASFVNHILESMPAELGQLAALMVPMLVHGYTIREMARMLRAPLNDVREALETIQELTSTWRPC